MRRRRWRQRIYDGSCTCLSNHSGIPLRTCVRWLRVQRAMALLQEAALRRRRTLRDLRMQRPDAPFVGRWGRLPVNWSARASCAERCSEPHGYETEDGGGSGMRLHGLLRLRRVVTLAVDRRLCCPWAAGTSTAVHGGEWCGQSRLDERVRRRSNKPWKSRTLTGWSDDNAESVSRLFAYVCSYHSATSIGSATGSGVVTLSGTI
jgi:hypothetical protein